VLTFSTSPSAAWNLVSLRLWKEILTTIEGLLVPPLSDRPTEMRPLSEKELDVVYKWLGVSGCSPLFPAWSQRGRGGTDSALARLQFLVSFFHGAGEGVPLEDLRNAKYLGTQKNDLSEFAQQS
jgi:hypothetical protein